MPRAVRYGVLLLLLLLFINNNGELPDVRIRFAASAFSFRNNVFLENFAVPSAMAPIRGYAWWYWHLHAISAFGENYKTLFLVVNNKGILLTITLRRDVYDARDIESLWKSFKLENLKIY